jgi:hypothetical protein
LSSGEGLIFHLREPRVEKQAIKDKGHVVDYEEVIVDHGVSDKRLLIVGEEFAQALKVMVARRQHPLTGAAASLGYWHPAPAHENESHPGH